MVGVSALVVPKASSSASPKKHTPGKGKTLYLL